MRVLAFEGFRFTSEAGDVDQLAAPPFDQIDAELQQRLHRRSRFQFARLTRPPGEGLEGARHSAQTHARWLAQGAIARDPAPALYPYSIELGGGGRRLGLCCLAGVLPEEAADLRPHEHTVAKPLADRLALLEATRIDYEPVFYLAEDDGSLEQALAEDIDSSAPIATHLDRARTDRHLLYRVESAERIRHYQSLLAARRAAIADGHHRTKVARLYAEKHAVPRESAASAKLAVLTSVASPGLAIDPIHRVVTAPIEPAAIEPLATTRTAAGTTDANAFAAAVATAGGPALGVWFRDREPEVWTLDPDRLPADAPGRRAGLSVVLLHHLLLPAAGLAPTSAEDGTIVYRSAPEDAAELLRAGAGTVAFFLPPMSATSFALATEDGSVLPPKSTRFLPKLISGLVWCGHDARTL